MPGKHGTVEERFWAKVIKNETGCWGWSAGTNKHGYGKVRAKVDGKNVHLIASRVSWEVHFGPIPKGKWVLHTCDNPPCTRPDHLYLGNCQMNHDDMVRRNRSTRGAKNPNARLSDNDIREIRRLKADGVVQRRIAERFGVSPATICLILKDRMWQHVA